MNFWLALFLAAVVLTCTMAAVFVILWLIVVMLYLPLTDDGSINVVIVYGVFSWLGLLAQGFFLIATGLIVATLEVLAFVRENLFWLLILALASTGALVWNEYHDVVIKQALIVRQCGVRPIVDTLIYPIGNIARIIYDVVIQVVNFFASISGFVTYGQYVILLECTASTLSLSNLMSYITIFLQQLFNDFKIWVEGQPLFDDFSILNGLEAFSNIFTAFVPVLDCFCKALHFVWVYLATLIDLPSLQQTINFAWIAFINFFQIPFFIIQSPTHTPDFTNITLHSCAAVESGGEFVEETLFLTVETIYGVITNASDLPDTIGQALSIKWASIITHPVCGVFRLVNMTLVVSININSVFAANGTGVAYFQFGLVFDELKVAAFQIGAIFGLLGNDAQSFVNNSLFALVDAVAFLFEWILGNVFFGSFGGPLPASFGLFGVSTTRPPVALRFWRYYFVDYWFKAQPLVTEVQSINGTIITYPLTLGNYTYSSALNTLFTELLPATQSLGNLVGLINVPLGQLVRHFFNILIGVLKFLANLISYSFCVLTAQCDNMPITARQVDLDFLYNESFFFAGAAGDIIRQFDNNSCDNTTDEVNKTFICMSGNIVETTLDVFILTVQQVFNFLQDLLTLPTGQLRLCLFENTNVSAATCLRVPDLTTAITELDDALCDFSYAVALLIPISPSFNCTFASTFNGTRNCAHVQTCLGVEGCAILGFLPAVLQIINALFVKVLNGTIFSNFEAFLEFSIGILVNQFALVFEQFALFLDCTICAIPGVPVDGCTSPIYDALKPIGDAIRELSKIFTQIFFTFVKIVLLLIVGLFTGNPIDAIVNFVFSFAKDIFLGIGTTIIDFLAKLFDRVGLGFLGSFIRVLYKGFCVVLEKVINAFIIILKVLSLGLWTHDYVEFGCTSDSQPQVGVKKREDGSLLPDASIILTNSETWMQDIITGHMTWPAEDACNQSIPLITLTPYSNQTDYQKGEVLFCFLKLMWAYRNDNQTDIGTSLCDALILENKDQAFSALGIHDKRRIIECMHDRTLVETVRHAFNLTWLPQDLLTNSWRKWIFGFELLNGYRINWQFTSDMSKPPSIILSENYQQMWSAIGLSTEHYKQLRTVDDVAAYRERAHLKAYFDANNATQYEATLYTVTGLWSLAGMVIKGIANVSKAFSDNETDAGVYLGYNYTLDNSVGASASSVLSLLSNMFGVINNFTTYWSNPDHYKKRTEAYDKLWIGASGLYNASIRQLRLMATEWQQTKIYESTHFYNQTCASESECRARGIPQFREAYEASMRGEDPDAGATSLVYKFSQWWNRLDLTTYPIKNPRYKDQRIQVDDVLFDYHDEHGAVHQETRWQRLTRHFRQARVGTRASQRRWHILSTLFERTRDKIYTRVLRRYYKDLYTSTPHHFAMQARHESEQGGRSAHSRVSPRGRKICAYPGSSECFTRYEMNTLSYEENHYGIQNKIDQNEIRRLNPLQLVGNNVFPELVFHASQTFLEVPCITNITFPCSFPLECDGNTTTNLCEQCLYLQAAIDRLVTATDQLIAYYEPGGPFSQELEKAFFFFNYTFDPNARVQVGDSPELHVALFPSKGDGFLDIVVKSARYYGDDIPNKTRLSDIVGPAQIIIGNSVPFQNSSLFTNPPVGINGIVFGIVSVVLEPVMEFFYNLVIFFVNTPDHGVTLFSFLGEMFIFCDWYVGNDFSGVVYRFAIGELVLIYAGIFIVASILTIGLFGFDILSLVLSAGITMTIIVSTFLTLNANWSFLCGPGLSVKLAYALFYFVVYDFFPKCSWFWGFMMDSVYTNTNCYSCETAQAAVLTQCVNKLGFFDFTYNFAFTLQFVFPGLLAQLRANTGFVRIILNIPFIADRLNFFAALNLDDPFLWSKYMGCNVIVTLASNFLIFVLFTIGVVGFVLPFVLLAFNILNWLWELLWQSIILILFIISDMVYNPAMNQYPNYNNYPPDTGDTDTGTAATTTSSTTTSTSTSRRMPLGRRIGSAATTDDLESVPKMRSRKLKQRASPHDYQNKPNSISLSHSLKQVITFYRSNWADDRKNK